MKENILKSINVWFAVNKNGKVRMFLDNPTKNVVSGKWDSKYPYVNSKLYKDIIQVVQQAKMTFENDPEVIQIQIKI